ncbi:MULTISPECIES: sensor domain-containing diguanylate cyclase [Sphingobium]|jgi:diguanylate cyclase (GGDEF)-like protein|uniref:diguanylate cyclase n=1 Tax=Sphingobium fuliginis (strain ATCC 27551) TaxID=336203 RepID=A0A292ZD55_SPHSA|nr:MULTISPECIES: sensor domain-containing diguanylate cyclase [Sphingobium]OAP32599.1 diguanylate cyclase [Sphingobium sp. 20006FA]KXU31028.1 diguanylate cyclase [Sphingobium sp. AM]KYC33415.1 diguanylate cyclase [Sphingobium sp. 22B]PNQ03117.1 diguanylate cyclase [Sphingobium sp. SA916]QOT70282.1 sensor domain-containing diguanylate cyclase [Sphingobium fuliginis]
MLDPKLMDEPARLAALNRYEVLDTPRESSFDRITDLVRSILGVPISAVSLVDTDRQWFKSLAGLDESETARDIAFCDHTIRQRAPMVITDAKEDARFRDNPLVTGDPNIRSYAGIPLETPDGYNIGSLCAIDTVPREFDPAQIAILKNLAALVVEQLELRRIAERDHLTGALSRRAFLTEMNRAIALFERHERPASLLLFDIDHFKHINDTYGHPAGDQVIRGIARLCAGLQRPSDSLGRLGGEEFGILLPETAEDDAARAAQRFCDAIAAAEMPGTPPLRATVSFGVAELRGDWPTGESWLAVADMALYEAKRSGRNRVAVARHGASQAT